jgi:CHAD domain-containing protein
MGHPATKLDGGPASQRRLLKLTQKRLERFVTLLPKVLANDDPETIHDLRVASRRLQQTLKVSIQQKTSGRRKIIRALRRVRKALGPCRNLDVNRDLAQRLLQESQSPAAREGWQTLATHFQEQREPLLAAARKQVAKCDLAAFIERARRLIAHACVDADPTAKMTAAVARSMARWDDAFRLAAEKHTVDSLHSLRIATKRLRYRAELLAESGSAALAPIVKDLKQMQTALGDWHDRSLLVQYAAEFLAGADFTSRHPDTSGALLAEMEKKKQSNDERIEPILSGAAKLRKRWTNGPAQEGRVAKN